MKKILTALLVLALFGGTALADTMMVHITATCYDTNSIGQYWQGAYSMGDMQIYDGDVLDIGTGKYDFYTEIGEYDNSPDIGSVASTFNVTANRLANGFKVEQYLTVEENKGTHKGNWCEWYITYSFEPCTVGTPCVIH